MPISHNGMLRYQALDAYFSDRGKYYFIENLLDAVNKLLANKGGRGDERMTCSEVMRRTYDLMRKK